MTFAITSRLPDTGITIFTRMSELARAHGAINLGQGFPDFDCAPSLIAHVADAMREGRNQYPPMAGIPELRAAIAKLISDCYGRQYDPTEEITVTAGATEALFGVILSTVRAGDEVIVLEPAYDSYRPAITLAGGTAVGVSMEAGQAGYALPFEALARALSTRTRLLILNTPHNPTGMVWQAADMARLADLLEGTDTLVCSDEVYEHMTFDGVAHESIARHPRLAARGFSVSSFGKSFHVTGWKVGYVAAPAALTQEFRKAHQYNVFTVNTPMQYGIARYMSESNACRTLAGFYQRKRDHMRTGLSAAGFRLLPCEGTYFQTVDYRTLGIPEALLPESEFAEWLTREIGVAAIPLSAFYGTPKDHGHVRFCFAKKDETLDAALGKLMMLAR